MRLRRIYALLCVLGVVLPFLQFVPWVGAHGLNLELMFSELFANRISAFFAWDVIVSALVLLVLAYAERKVLGGRVWLPVVAVFCVGVSLGLPLLLYLREDARSA